MIQVIAPWLADGLALLGLGVLTLSVFGILRFPNVITRLHASGQAGVMGVVPLLLAVMLTSGGDMLPRTILVVSFLVVTSPIVAHEIGRAAHSVRERTGPNDF